MGKSWSTDYGIDLGTANVLIYSADEGIVLREPTIVAMDNYTDRVLAIGQEAYRMVGRTPGNITLVNPLVDGVIADFDVTEIMLRHFLRKLSGRRSFRLGFSPRVVACAPCGVTNVERRAVEDVIRGAGARSAMLMEEPLAAAIGAGLDVANAKGCMVVDIGGGTTEVAVISLGGIVISHSIRVAGKHMNDGIVSYVKRAHDLLIGERTAEDLKINIGTAYPLRENVAMDVKGRDITVGLPRTMRISAGEIREALVDPVQSIVEAVRNTLEDTPPEIASDIMQEGIMLTGGGALLAGLDRCLSAATGLPVYVAENALDCVAVGAGQVAKGLVDISASFA